MTKKSLAVGALLVTFGVGAMGVGTTFAATGNGEHKPMEKLIEAIATKFNLAPADVQAVFDEQREIRQEHRAENHAEHLAKAVADGKLTQAQADAITANIASQKAFVESLKGMTDAERQTAIQANHESQKAWAEASGIPKEFLPKGRPFGGKHGGVMHPGPRAMEQLRDRAEEQVTQD